MSEGGREGERERGREREREGGGGGGGEGEDEREMERLVERGMIDEYAREDGESLVPIGLAESDGDDATSADDPEDGYTDEEGEEDDEETEEDEEGDFEKYQNRLLLGIDYDRQDDNRSRYNNLSGTKGSQTLLQKELITSLGLYFQNETKLSDIAEITLGARYDDVTFDVTDKFLSNGDDSGKINFNENIFSEFSQNRKWSILTWTYRPIWFLTMMDFEIEIDMIIYIYISSNQ